MGKSSNNCETAIDVHTVLCISLFKKLLIERLKNNKPKELRDIRVEAKKLFDEMGIDNGSSEQTGCDEAEILINLPTIKFKVSIEDVV